MTKEEAVKILSESIHDCSKVSWDKIVEAVHLSIEALSRPPLPSNLDEASEEFATTSFKDGRHIIDADRMFGFKAGAEWMAGQGGTIECAIDWYDGPIPDCSEEQLFSAIEKAELEVGDKVIIQIRKK